MNLSKTSAQAALAIAFLAQHRDTGYIQARTIAQHLRVPTDSALKILQCLTRRGLTSSQLGRTGGYRVTLEPGQITLLQVVEAIDGPITSEMPVSQPHLSGAIEVLQTACRRAADRMRHELAGTSINQLLQTPCSQPLLQVA